jgi:hypothetical protein
LSDRYEVGRQVVGLQGLPTALRDRVITAVQVERAALGVGEHGLYLLGLSLLLSRSSSRPEPFFATAGQYSTSVALASPGLRSVKEASRAA